MAFQDTAFGLLTESIYSDPNLRPLTGTYTPSGGAPVIVQVLQSSIDPVLNIPGMGGGTSAVRSAVMTHIKQCEVSVKPPAGSTLVYDGKTYRISSADDPDGLGLEWRLDMQRLS